MKHNNDPEQLDALFDSMAFANQSDWQQNQNTTLPEQGANFTESDSIYHKIGQLIRKLNDSLKELGQNDTIFERGPNLLPENRERLSFISQLMERSANTVLNECEKGIQITGQSLAQHQRWETLFLKLEEHTLTATELKEYVLAQQAQQQQQFQFLKTLQQLFQNLILAQEFQDLAGQTLNKVLSTTASLEQELLELLKMASEKEAPLVDVKGKEKLSEFLSGPCYKKDDQETLKNQEQVDDLLKSLGF